jgi:hypothetical protein
MQKRISSESFLREIYHFYALTEQFLIKNKTNRAIQWK